MRRYPGRRFSSLKPNHLRRVLHVTRAIDVFRRKDPSPRAPREGSGNAWSLSEGRGVDWSGELFGMSAAEAIALDLPGLRTCWRAYHRVLRPLSGAASERWASPQVREAAATRFALHIGRCDVDGWRHIACNMETRFSRVKDWRMSLNADLKI